MINIRKVILLILRKRPPSPLKEIVSNWSEKDVVNGIAVKSLRLFSKEKLSKVKNMLSDQVQTWSLMLCKLIEEMIVKKSSATVSQWLQTTLVKVLSVQAVASVSHRIKL